MRRQIPDVIVLDLRMPLLKALSFAPGSSEIIDWHRSLSFSFPATLTTRQRDRLAHVSGLASPPGCPSS
jgi:hypothetical protein